MLELCNLCSIIGSISLSNSNPNAGYKFSCLIVLGFILVVRVAFAQDAGALQQQLQRQVEKNRPSNSPENFIKKPLQGPSIIPNGKDTILVTAFELTGMSLVPQEQGQDALQNFVGKELSFSQIQEAATVVTELYTKKGRVATFVIPPQEVKDGLVAIKILEAKVGSVLIQKEDGQLRLRFKPEIAGQFIRYGNPEGQFLNLDELERSLAILNEIPGVIAVGGVEPGQEDGTTNINVKMRDASLLTGRVETSNFGSASTGVIQATGNFNLNNYLGIGDLATLDIISSQGSDYETVRYWMPVGSGGWRTGVGGSKLNYTSLSSFSSISSNGSALTYGLYTTFPLARTATVSESLSFNLENRSYVNYTTNIESSRYKITSLNSGFSSNKSSEGSILSYGANWVIGKLEINNINQLSADQSTTGPLTQGVYTKLSFNANYTQPFLIEKTNLQLSLNGQLSNKNLNSSEQIYLGGTYAVRAYPIAQGGGSEGVVGSIEVTHTYVNQLQLGAFLDAGIVKQYASHWNSTLQGNTNASNTYTLYAAGLTSKYRWKDFQLQGVVAFRIGDNPLYNAQGLQLNADNQYRAVQAWLKGSYFFN